MGRIVHLNFAKEYKKELPKSICLQGVLTPLISRSFLVTSKYSCHLGKHAVFIGKHHIEATPDFVNEVVKNCRPSCRKQSILMSSRIIRS